MAQYRDSGGNIGNEPPQSIWTIVRGDTASFKMYVQDDSCQPLVIGDWNIKMDFYRQGATSNPILEVYPEADPDDGPGEFTIYLSHTQTEILDTNDQYDIQLSLLDMSIVWTVLQGKIKMIEDITD
jgi:hypothetical protein